MMNKKAESVGTTITWLVATPIIVVILVIFVIFSLFLFGAEKGGIDVRKHGVIADEMILTEKITTFLETPVEDRKVKDLIEGTPRENPDDFNKFSELTNEFINENFGRDYYDSAWVRVYDLEEQTNSQNYKILELKTQYIYGGECDPRVAEERLYLKYDIPKVLFFEFPLKNKKIAICAKYKENV